MTIRIFSKTLLVGPHGASLVYVLQYHPYKEEDGDGNRGSSKYV